MSDDIDRIWRAIIEIGTCMMVTRDGDILRARPMQALPEPDENAIWFLSEKETHKDSEIENQPKICLAFADVEDDLYVSLSGTLEVIRDEERITTLLSDDAEVEDDEAEAAKNLIALLFKPEIGEIWDGWSLADDDEDEEGESEVEGDQVGSKVSFGKNTKGDL